MSASQIASQVPGGTAGADPPATAGSTAQAQPGPVLVDTGRISGNMLVLTLSLAEGQQQSNKHLYEIGHRLQGMVTAQQHFNDHLQRMGVRHDLSNNHLSEMVRCVCEMRSCLQGMHDHLKTCAENSTRFYTAAGVIPGEPTAHPTFNHAIDQQSINSLVSCLGDFFKPKFDELSQQVRELQAHGLPVGSTDPPDNPAPPTVARRRRHP
jgi:hypothetical protein